MKVVVDIMVSYHHVQYQKKIMIQILRKLSDGRTDGRTESDFKGLCPTYVERPKIETDLTPIWMGEGGKFYPPVSFPIITKKR